VVHVRIGVVNEHSANARERKRTTYDAEHQTSPPVLCARR
jgi:hypothetical protein